MLAIAELTIKKIKEPAFVIMLIISLMIGYVSAETGMGSTLPQIESGSFFVQMLQSQQGFSILTSSFFALALTSVLTIFIGASEIPRDINSGMILIYLGKPISRSSYLLGKFAGTVVLCLFFFTVTEVTVFLTHSAYTKHIYSFGFMLRQYLMFLPIFPLVAMTLMVSCFFADLSAMILTAAYLAFCFSMSTIPLLIAMLPKSMTGGLIYFYMIYYLFPNFIYYFLSYKLGSFFLLFLLIYTVSISAIFLSIAAFRLKNRDLI